jgi:hypothetical protein
VAETGDKSKRQQAQDAILDEINKNPGNSLVVLRLAEAWAWLREPSQPHGGGPADAST